MAKMITSKDLLSEMGYTEPKGTVTMSGLDIPRDVEPLRKTKKIDLENLNPDLQDRIAKMQEDWKNNKELNPKGLDLPITSGARTAQQQEDLKKRAAAGEKGIFTPADVPKGASMVHLNAIDLPTSVPDSFLEQYGLYRPLVKKGDPVHVQINPNSTYEVPTFKGISSADLLKEMEGGTPEQGQQNKVYSPLDVMAAGISKGLFGNTVAPQEVKPNTMLEKLLGGIEAAGSMASGAVTAIPSAMAYGYVPKGSQPSAYEEAKKRSELISQFQYKPQTQTGQNLVEMLGNAPKAILGTSAPLPPMLGVESQLLGRMGYEKPPAINAPKVPSKYALTEPSLQQLPNVSANLTPSQVRQKVLTLRQKVETLEKEAHELNRDVINPESSLTEAEVISRSREVGNKRQLAQKLRQEIDDLEKNSTNVTPISTLSGVGAAMVENNPFSGKLSGESYGRGEIFPQIKLSKTANDVPMDEQTTRSAIVGPILKDSKQIRPGVLTGNEDTLRYEHTEATRPDKSPYGHMLQEQIANEQNALTNWANERIEKTGASRALLDDAERADAINNAFIGHYNPKTKEFEGFTGFVNKLKSEVYDDAKKAVGDNPIKSTHIDELLNDEQFKAGLGLKQGNEGVATSAEKLINLAKTIGFKDPITKQRYKPNSINGFIAVKKALNEKWDQNNKNIIAQVNRAIDQDIFSAGGGDLFKKGDALHEAEKIIFESKGMDTIFGEFDRNGIKKGVDQDKIMAKLNSLDTAQWKHIYNTADMISNGTLRVKGYEFKIPESVIEQANMIKSEMKGSIAREIFKAGEGKAGVWNQNSANKTMNSRQGKIRYAFDPEEQQAFYRLNLAGQIMPGIHSYQGGAMQAEGMGWGQRIAEKVPFLSGAIASSLTHGAGTGAGIAAGEAGKNLLLRNLSKKDAVKMQETMKNNYNLGNLMELKKGNEK
jgi:hypothetical protein